MIATVKIAPVERWCESERNYPYDWTQKPDGASVQIITNAVKKSDWCEGRAWMVANTNQLRQGVGQEPLEHGDTRYLCEHMLEMD